MIALLTGLVAQKTPTHVTLDVHGVGYEVLIPLSTYYAVPNQLETATLHVHTHVREDAIQLYGFLTTAEKDAFLLLTGISGIGPKLGLSVLSTLSVQDLSRAIQTGDIETLGTVSGIGKKSAARIALELKDKVAKLQPPAPAGDREPQPGRHPFHDDALSALVNLGYRLPDVKETLKRIEKTGSTAQDLKDLIREALQALAKG